jgi:hypothetical protein
LLDGGATKVSAACSPRHLVRTKTLVNTLKIMPFLYPWVFQTYNDLCHFTGVWNILFATYFLEQLNVPHSRSPVPFSKVQTE